MNYKEFASKIKTKYPQYQDMDDRDLSERMMKKFPEYSDVTFDEPKNDWRQLITSSAKESFTRPARAMKDLFTNPQTMANAMPALLGTVGGVSPVPGGATIGTATGQGVRDLALTGLKKPIPGLMQHGLELAGAALGDIAAVPALKKGYYGGQIGQAEKAAGLMTRAPTKAVTPGSVGETLNNLEAQIDAGTINTPQAARDAKSVVNQIYKNPKIYESTSDIKVQAARVAKKTQNLLNQMVPGRLAPSQAMGRAMTIPNALKKGYMSMPWALRHGAEAALGWETIRKLLGL